MSGARVPPTSLRANHNISVICHLLVHSFWELGAGWGLAWAAKTTVSCARLHSVGGVGVLGCMRREGAVWPMGGLVNPHGGGAAGARTQPPRRRRGFITDSGRLGGSSGTGTAARAAARAPLIAAFQRPFDPAHASYAFNRALQSSTYP